MSAVGGTLTPLSLSFYPALSLFFSSPSCSVSRSETSEWIHSRQGGFSVTVSEYQTEALLCDGSELSFEEVRAAKYQRVPPEAITEQRKDHAEGV